MSDTFRRAYRELTDAEKERVEQIKDAATRLEMLINSIIDPNKPHVLSQLIQVEHAQTNLQQAVMWATKAAT